MTDWSVILGAARAKCNTEHIRKLYTQTSGLLAATTHSPLPGVAFTGKAPYNARFSPALFAPMSDCFDANDLIRLFNATFAESHNTLLARGDDEPLYLPADATHSRHRILFAHGYFASALHEIAHWCLAGQRRRQLEDYGYWYRPDGRDAREQAEFERVESRPQAIEWAFHIAAGSVFRPSADNLSGAPVDMARFRSKIHAWLQHYNVHGFPPRARIFIDRLCAFYRREWRIPEAA